MRQKRLEGLCNPSVNPLSKNGGITQQIKTQ
jgi:hypothetical protein